MLPGKTDAHVRPVGSGKTALLLALCRALRDDYNIGALSRDRRAFTPDLRSYAALRDHLYIK